MRGHDLSYPEHGATAGDVLPSGYRHVRRSAVLGHGPAVFTRAARALTGWEMHRRAGLRVRATGPATQPGCEVVLGIGPLSAPCRVVYTVGTADACGFAYGTMVGHPESGEEAFVVRLAPDGEVIFEIVAFSRPATRIARWSGPVGRAVQDWVTARYATALRALAA